MSVAFDQSETHRNLLRAFAGESQARNRYTFAAGLSKQKGLHVVEAAFTFTAGQEQAHAKVFYNRLESLSGKTIPIDGTYPVDLYPGVLEQLRAAQHNEYQEWDHDYAQFARVAEQEEFLDVAKLFTNVAAIEKTHGDRFGQLADLLEANKLFVADASVKWMCLHCGHILDAVAAPAACPVCKHPQGYFVRLELAPWTAAKGS